MNATLPATPDVLAAIASQLRVLDAHTYELRGQAVPVTYPQAYTRWHQPLGQFGQNTGDDHQDRAQLLACLTQVLYGTYYCTGSTSAPTPPALALPLPAARQTCIERLSAANQTADGFDPAWTVYAVDAHGTAWVTKNGQLRSLAPGQWEPAGPGEAPTPHVGAVVRLRISREDRTAQPVFYHVRSRAVLPAQASLVRVYINITFEGAVALVEALTGTFNRYRLPFMFKCLNHPALYTRADSAVLYLDKFDFNLAARLLPAIFEPLRPELQAVGPLFTRGLLPGVSFSEDPGQGQSFGMSRCTLLAEALVNAHDKHLPTLADALAEMRRAITKSGLDETHFYRNPNSHFPYDFARLGAA
ncbi:T3SS effector HopA1 family protein [Hymenobacter cheonanensis]|uniref:T3SS effector HopA1 family protein n=1 Tax=Hymenobacter sp. CA2-7 TaxID=3063993 RepID=UPI0027141BD5|nr:T3SS effector HopA1 family protein [Hymenobacter sp. CA2-7]MDO7884226.1 T3SS effector HopA1 family protein [Hymenobacter sp. CA2-7]